MPLAVERVGRLAVLVAAGLSVLAGVAMLVMHLSTDPLVDARAYYDAATRLNAGQPLYPVDASPTGAYLYPPLLAILFRPLALLPFPVAAAAWETVVLAATGLTIRRIGFGSKVRLALAFLALPLAWALAIGQAEPVVMLLLAIGSPWSVALAGSVKLFPWLAALHWAGRRDVRSLAVFTAWVAGLAAVQLVLEPAGTLAYLRLEWLHPAFDVRNFSLYAVHPLAWGVALLAIAVLAVLTARSKAGWPLAVVLVVAAAPRLLVYQLITLLAGFGGPRARSDGGSAR